MKKVVSGGPTGARDLAEGVAGLPEMKKNGTDAYHDDVPPVLRSRIIVEIKAVSEPPMNIVPGFASCAFSDSNGLSVPIREIRKIRG